MESNIKKLSMREIISKVGFPITINEFRNTYKFNVDLQFAMEFEEQLKQIHRMSEIEKIICRYENIFDKEIYVFHLARLLERDIETIKRAELLGQNNIEQLVFTNDVTGKNKRRFLVNAKNLLKKCDVIDIVMKKKTKGEFEIYSSIDFIEQNTEFTDNLEAEAIKKLGIIEQKIGLKNVLRHIKNSDLSDICRYPNLAMLLIVEKEDLEYKIKKHIQYIDLDKMLVLANAIYFYKYGENFYSFSKEEAYELNDFTQKVSKIVGERVKYLQTSRFYFTVDYSEIKEKVEILLKHEENSTLKEDSVSLIEQAEQLTKDIIENEMLVEEDILLETENETENETEETIKESAEEIVEKLEEVAEESAEEIAEETAEETAEEIAEEIAEETAEETAEEIAEEIAEETAEEISSTIEIDNEEDVFKTKIIKSEEEFLENTLESKEKVLGEIFELANLEKTIEETTVENEVQGVENQEVAVEDEVQEVENQEVAVEDEVQEIESQETIIENEISESEAEEKQEYSNSNNKYINNFINNSSKIVMNFENRKNTIFKLDENYSQETLDDGTTIFSLPNKGCYIIETTSDNLDLGGKATYIVNKDLFEAKRNFLIENNSLKTQKISMLKLNNYKDVTKLVYTGWENAIITFFNMKTEEKYTQEEKDNINRIISRING